MDTNWAAGRMPNMSLAAFRKTNQLEQIYLIKNKEK